MPAKTVESQRSSHKTCVSSVNGLIKDISTDDKLPYNEFTEGEKEVQQLLSELEKTNEFLLLNLDESQHCQFLDETLAVKRNSRRKLNLIRRKLKVGSDLVNNSTDTQTRLPTYIQQQTLQSESEHREIPQETLSSSTGITLISNQPATFQNSAHYQLRNVSGTEFFDFYWKQKILKKEGMKLQPVSLSTLSVRFS